MPKIDDIIPFLKKKTKDVAETVEEKRKAIDEDRKKKKLGTFSGLEGIIAKHKSAVEEAASYSD